MRFAWVLRTPHQAGHLAAALAQLARDPVPPLAELADGAVARNRAAALEPAGVATDAVELALGARAAGPGPDRPDDAVARLERDADRDQDGALGDAGDLGA